MMGVSLKRNVMQMCFSGRRSVSKPTSLTGSKTTLLNHEPHLRLLEEGDIKRNHLRTGTPGTEGDLPTWFPWYGCGRGRNRRTPDFALAGRKRKFTSASIRPGLAIMP